MDKASPRQGFIACREWLAVALVWGPTWPFPVPSVWGFRSWPPESPLEAWEGRGKGGLLVGA